MSRYDAVVVGAGPNGLAAAIEIARNGRSVLVLEAGATVGGGTRSAELTLPGFTSDVCSAVHPLGAASPYLNSLPLDIEWVQPTVPLAHPMDDGTAVLLHRSIEETAKNLGPDADRYTRLMRRLVRRADALIEGAQSPAVPVPKHPFLMAWFLTLPLRSSATNVRVLFRGERARALTAGTSAHAMLPIRSVPAQGIWLLFHLCAHTAGWPVAKGGSQAIADAMASHLRSLGGEIECGRHVSSLRDVPDSRAVLFDLTPRQVVAIAADELPSRYRRRLGRFRYGPGVFKVDYALEGPVPWKAAEVTGAGTVHIGGTYEEIAASEAAVASGRIPERPWMLVAQQSLFDASRAPAGKQVLWTYTHVPPGSAVDMTEAMEAQLERFAPGFRDLVIARHVTTPAELERYNENYIGGDIAGGLSNLRQFFTRPVAKLDPYATPNPRLFICSASTPPGAGVHGMCGYHAARSALRRLGA